MKVVKITVSFKVPYDLVKGIKPNRFAAIAFFMGHLLQMTEELGVEKWYIVSSEDE